MDSTDTQTALDWWTLDRRKLAVGIDGGHLMVRADGTVWDDRNARAGTYIQSSRVSKDRIGPLLDAGFVEVDSVGRLLWTDAGRESRKAALDAREAAAR